MFHPPSMGDTITVDAGLKFKVESIDWQTQEPDPYHDRDVIHIHLAPFTTE